MLDSVNDADSGGLKGNAAAASATGLASWFQSKATGSSSTDAAEVRGARSQIEVLYPDFPGDDLSHHIVDCACAACMSADPFKDDVEWSDEPVDGGTESAAAEVTLQTMADFLSLGYWNNGTGQRHNVTDSGLDANDGVLYYNVSGFNALSFGGGEDDDGISAARAELVRDAFDIYEAVLGIDFVETTSRDDSVVDFFFSDNKGGAYAGSTRYGDGTIYYSYINIAASWSGGSSTYDDYTLQTIFHEIGHALGLGHQGPYNGSANFGNDAIYQLDSWQATMMSYFSQTQNSFTVGDREFLQTPMAVDWIALDDIYGAQGFGVENAFTGNTTWGFNTNITAQESAIWNDWENWADRTASTLIDSGGIDTLDVSGYGNDQRIDLTVQTAAQKAQNTSDIGGRDGNLTLGIGTIIENAIGGNGNDTFTGNTANNVFEGGGGNDTFNASLGNDSYDGGTGTDAVLYNLSFSAYAVSLLADAVQIVGEGVDTVFDTIETIAFTDVTYSFTDLLALFVNTPPEAVDDTASVAEDKELTLDVLANDADADADPLTITSVEGQAISAGETVDVASGAQVTLNGNGTLSYAQNGAFEALNDGESATDTFTYGIADGQGGSDTALVTVTIDGADDAVAAAPIGQAGTETVTQAGSDQWHTVTFDAAILDAVVVMGPVSTNDGSPVTTRVRNITDTGFEFQIDEWEYLDGVHGTETVSWLAMTAGTHLLENGQTAVAGTQSVSTSPTTVSFGTALSTAVVFSEVSSVNEDTAVVTRMRRITDTSFELRLDEEQAGGSHVAEDVSWIAIEAGAGNGVDVFRTGDVVDEEGYFFSFNEAFDETPVLIADMQTLDGGDTSAIRQTFLNENGVTLFVEEEKSADSEVRHTEEVAGYVALEDGLIYASGAPSVAPVAAGDAVTVAEDDIAVIDVVANDTDADGDALSVVAVNGQAISEGETVTLSSGATVTLGADGRLSYDQQDAFEALNTGETGSDSFDYTVSDGRGGTDTATVSVTVEGETDILGGPIGQAGTETVTQASAGQWHTVTFDAAISGAVVVMGPVSFNGTDPVTTRIRNVTDTGFEFQIDEWEYLDGVHAAENVSWMAISEGTHTLAGGQTIVAGEAGVGGEFSDVSFGSTLDSAIIFTEVATVNDPTAVSTRIRNVDGEGFEVSLRSEEAEGTPGAESVGWIAVETGATAELEAVRTRNALTHEVDTFVFTPSFDAAPVLLGDLQTFDGRDTSVLRLTGLDSDSVSLFVEEEQSADAEVAHTSEAAGYLALEDGLIFDALALV